MREVPTRFRLLRTPLRADRVCDAFEVPPLNELGLLAQLVEQVTLNHRVGGSSPSQPTISCNLWNVLRKSEVYLFN